MKFDTLFPEFIGGTGIIIANTLVGLDIYLENERPYPLDLQRINMLLYGINSTVAWTLKKPCFYEPFIALEIDDMLVPVLPSVTAIYGDKPPCLIAGADGNALCIHLNEKNTTGEIIGAYYKKSMPLSNQELLEYLKSDKRSHALRKMVSGQILR